MHVACLRAPRPIASLLSLAGLFLLAVLLALPSSPLGGSAGPTTIVPAPARALMHAPSGSGGVASSLAPRPFASSNSTYYLNTTHVVGKLLSTHKVCATAYYYEGYCYYEDTTPSVLALANGDVAITSEITTSQTSSKCFNATNQTSSRIGISFSTNGGASFGSVTYLGDVGNSTCPYFQQIEPAFTTDGAGNVVGVYVGANATRGDLLSPGVSSTGPINAYGVRPVDALIFTKSTNNGSNFTNGTVLISGGNVTRPAIATSGATIYVAYMNISNGSTPLPGSTTLGSSANASYPASINVLVSEDDGLTWHGPFNVPGENTSQGNTAFSPSIAVGPDGTVAVAYATNRSCVAYCNQAYYQTWGDDIVVALSTNNGSTWGAPRTVSYRAAESATYFYSYATGTYLYYVWQFAPTTTVTWDPSGDLFVGWNGAVNQSSGSYYEDYVDSQVFAGVSTDLGVSWTTSVLGGPVTVDQQYYNALAYYAPVVAYHGGVVYYSYVLRNDTYGGGSSQCSFTSGSSNGATLAQTYSSWVATSSDGIHWNPGALISSEPGVGGSAYGMYLGWTGSIGFLGTGGPVVAQTLPISSVYTYQYPSVPYYLYTYSVNVSVGHPDTSNVTVNLTVDEFGLPAGTSWGVTLSGNPYRTTATSLAIGGIPKGLRVVLVVDFPTITTSSGLRRVAAETGGIFVYNAAQNTYKIYSQLLAPLTFAATPMNIPYFDIYIEVYNATTGLQEAYYYWYFETYFYQNRPQFYEYGCPFPWYLPAGLNLTIGQGSSYPVYAYYYDDFPPSAWIGSGNGSYSGYGPSVPLSMDGAITETATWLPSGNNYSVVFGAPGLPSTSNYSFEVNHTTYASPASANVTVDHLAWGPYSVSNITASSSRAGWSYFGHPSTGDPILVPNDPRVNLTYAFVNTSSAPGTVTFHATNLTDGTVWQLAFNGTTYSSTTPWINVTTRSGQYSLAAYPVAASIQATSSYAPVGVPAEINASTGHTYSVEFAPAFALDVVAGAGGSASPAGRTWELPGTQTTITSTVGAAYTWYGWTGTGPGSYTGLNRTAVVTVDGPVTETASFAPLLPNRFNLTFDESGIPNGTLWTVYVGGVGYSSTTNVLQVPNLYSCALSGGLGRYNVLVPYDYANGTANLTRYVPASYARTDCGGTNVALVFVPQYFLTLESTVGGSLSATYLTTYANGSAWFPAAAVVALSAIHAAGYAFVAWNGTGPGSYSGPLASPTVTMLGPVDEVATFLKVVTPAPMRYHVVFVPSIAFAAGTSWTLSIGSSAYSSSSGPINVTGLLANVYTITVQTTLSPDGKYQYAPILATQQIRVVGNNSNFPVGFRASAWVAISAVGPGTVDPSSGWFPVGSQFDLNASAAAGAEFAGWQGSGAGAYSGGDPGGNVTVTSPISEVGTFILVPPAAKQLTSPWNNLPLQVLLGVVGLVVGLAVGVLLLRRRPAPPPSSSADASVGAGTPATESVPADSPPEPGPDVPEPEPGEEWNERAEGGSA